MSSKSALKILPPSLSDGVTPELPAMRQVTIVGGAGTGKSLFMQEMMRLCGDRAYCLSALEAPFPQRDESTLPGSIDSQFREAVKSKSYMRSDAVSQLDKLAYMLFVDEFESLLHQKERYRAGADTRFRDTRLDRLMNLWENIFPGSHVVRATDRLMFATTAGDDLISMTSLSRGETAVLYYIAAVLYAPARAVIFIDQPSQFVHPSVVQTLWNSLEELRPDCTFVYDTVDIDFVSSRTENVCVWVKSFDSAQRAWDYELLSSSSLNEEVLAGLVGTRKPVLFIEGDAEHSIDAKLYRLVFTGYTVRPLGSCNKVIETTRTFNDLKYLHHLESHGIVDRDRRNSDEVDYLRHKSIFVPNVAEVENIFLLPSVMEIMARRRGKDPDKVVAAVRHNVMKAFATHYDEQALQHVRHKVKRDVECKIDGRFTCITAMETHLRQLVEQLQPRLNYENLRKEFTQMLAEDDYIGVLRVFNHKPILSDCGIDRMLGYSSRDEYIAGVLQVLKRPGPEADQMRASIKFCFGLGADDEYLEELPVRESKRHRRKAIANRLTESDDEILAELIDAPKHHSHKKKSHSAKHSPQNNKNRSAEHPPRSQRKKRKRKMTRAERSANNRR